MHGSEVTQVKRSRFDAIRHCDDGVWHDECFGSHRATIRIDRKTSVRATTNSSTIAIQNPIAELLLLHAVDRLVAATGADDLEAASQSLLDDLIPGATVRRVSAAAAQRYPESASVHVVRVPLHDGAMLVLTSPRALGCLAPLRMAAKVIESRVQALGQHNDLSTSIEQLRQYEESQRALYAIANLASDAGTDCASLFRGLHASVAALTFAKNFFIALYDAADDSITYPYYVDEADGEAPAASVSTSMADIAHSPTWYVIHEGKVLWGTRAQLQATIGPAYNSTGPQCVAWLGVPLLSAGKTIGCVVVQSYDSMHTYSERDRDLLVFLAQHIGIVLERRIVCTRRRHAQTHPQHENAHDGIVAKPGCAAPVDRADRVRQCDW